MSEGPIQSLAILGASGHGKVVADLAELLGYTVTFYDDAYPEKAMLEHWPIAGTFNDLLSLDSDRLHVAVAIGHNSIRQGKITTLLDSFFELPTLIHPTSIVSRYANIESGCVILAGSTVNAFATIGKGVIINSGAVIEHDCELADFVHICPNVALAGGVKVGLGAWVGIGSQVRQLVSIGEHSLIGAGSTVIKNISANVVAFGSPAIVIKQS